MAQAPAGAKKMGKDGLFQWEGVDRLGRRLKGTQLAASEMAVRQNLIRQGIHAARIRRRTSLGGRKIGRREVALFTRQLAALVRAGVPLMQAFEMTARSQGNPAMQRMLGEIRADVEAGSALNQAFRRHPACFDALFCNLVAAGEQAGILDAILDRIAAYQEKMLAIQGRIRSALAYPAIVVVAALLVTAGMLIFVIPVFADLFRDSGAELPGLTRMVMRLSDGLVAHWWLMLGVSVGAAVAFAQALRRSPAFRDGLDALMLRLPLFGRLIEKAALAKWARTFSAMFAAGVPLVETLESVAGATGNAVFRDATRKVRLDVVAGASLNSSLLATQVFPPMLVQMAAIGEESGALDGMIDKVADFYEREVDEMASGLSSLMEPIIMLVLGGLIGTLVVAMYLPIFKMGSAF